MPQKGSKRILRFQNYNIVRIKKESVIWFWSLTRLDLKSNWLMYRIIKLNSMACLLPGLNKLIKCKSFVNIILSFSSYDLDLKYSSIFGGAVDFSAYISQLPQWVQKCECHIIFIASRNSISMAVCGPPNGYSPNCCHYHCLATYRHRYASTYRHTHTHAYEHIL